MNIRTITAFGAGAVVALVLGTGTTYAANGGHFVLGRSNNESSAASLNNSNGTALVLRSKAGTPSLIVNRTTKVPNLNADMVDSVNSDRLARVVTVGTVTAVGEVVTFGTPETDDDVIAALAVCPGNSQVMGGGADDFSEDGLVLSSAPDEGNAWFVLSSATPTQENAEQVAAYARCWSPRVNITDSNARTAPGALSPSARKLAAKAARAK